MAILIDPKRLLWGKWLRTEREANGMPIFNSAHSSTPCGSVSIYMPWFRPEVK